MKSAKAFTDAIAILLAVLLLIYLLTCYVKYKPSESDLLENSKLSLFLDSTLLVRQTLYLTIMLAFSAAVNLILRKRPAFCLIVSAIPLCYALTVYGAKGLTVHPMVIIIGCTAHAAGAIFFAAAEDRRTGRASTAAGGILATVAALAVSTACSVRQSAAASVMPLVEEMEKDGITIPSKLRSGTDFVRRLYDLYVRRGKSYAVDMAADHSREFDAQGTKLYYLSNIDPEQLTTYIRLSLILFAVGVLWFALRRRTRLIPAVIAWIPPIYVFFSLLFGKLSAMPLMLLALSLIAAACAAADREQYGKIPVSEAERAQFAEDEAERAADITASAGNSVDASAANDENGEDGENDKDDEDEEIYYDMN